MPPCASGFRRYVSAARFYSPMTTKLPDAVALRKIINLRTTAEERAQVARFAAAKGLSVSQLLRQALLEIGALPGGDAARA